MAKLVEILARELSAWKGNADGAVFSSKGGACYFFHGNKPAYDDFNWRATAGCFWFIGANDKIVFDAETPEDHNTAIVTRAEWQEARNALKTKESPSLHAQAVGRVTRIPEWNGEELPPVGAVCEHQHLIPGEEWTKVEIVAHRTFDGDDCPCAVFVYSKSSSHSSAGDHFRPIRTPGQIAAEEREKFIDEMIKVTCIRRGEAGLIYDAGYRKQEPK